MSIDLLSPALLGGQAALLPDPQLLPWLIRCLWALVLGCICLRLTQRFAPGWRMTLTALLLALTLMPGDLSPAWWLGLAFKAPSLMGAGLCLAWALKSQADPPIKAAGPLRFRGSRPGVWATAGLLLGWVLLLDLLAQLPFSLYALGFGTPALVVVLIGAALLWALTPPAPGSGLPAACLALSLVLFVFTRWPSGNLWDALIDPWLWIALHLRLVRRAGASTSQR